MHSFISRTNFALKLCISVYYDKCFVSLESYNILLWCHPPCMAFYYRCMLYIYTMMWSMVSCYKFTVLFCRHVGCFCQLQLTSYVSNHSAYSEYHRKNFFSTACANHFLLPFEELAKLVLNLGEVFSNHSWKSLLVCLNHFWNSSGKPSSQPWIVTVDFWSWGSMSLTSLFQYAGLLHSPGPAVNTAIQRSTKQNTTLDFICYTAGTDQLCIQ